MIENFNINADAYCNIYIQNSDEEHFLACIHGYNFNDTGSEFACSEYESSESLHNACVDGYNYSHQISNTSW